MSDDISVSFRIRHLILFFPPVSICSAGVGAPVVGECEGDYNHDSRKHVLTWTIPVVDSSNGNGSMEFTVPGSSDDFMPIKVEFVSATTFCQIKVCVCVCC